MRSLKKIIALIDAETRRSFIGVFFFCLGASLLETVGLGILPIFVKLLAKPDALMDLSYVKPVVGYLGIEDENDFIFMGCICLLVFFLLKTLYMVKVYHVQARFMRNVMVGIGNRMFDTYLFAPYTFHLNAKSGEIIRNVTHAPQYFGAAVVLSAFKIFLHGIITLGILILLGLLHPQITLLALILPAIVAWGFLAVVRKSTSRHGQALQEALANMTSITNHALGSIKETHVRGCYEFLRSHFRRQMDRLGAAHQFQKFVPVIAKPLMELLGVSVFVVLVLFFLFNEKSLASAIPVIVLFLAAIVRIIQNVLPMTQSFIAIRSYSYLVDQLAADIKKVKDERQILGDEPSRNIPSIRSINVPEKSLRLMKDIEVRNLSFQYPNSNRWALEAISLKIPRHSAVAFVGRSGSGKTTLVDLILGLLSPQEGKIFVGGSDIHTNLRNWQNNIGYIPQTIYLMDESIRQNVAFGVPIEEIKDDRVWEVLRMSQIDTFVRNLPDGLYTNIGERGVLISGGERQRIGIARALYNQPDVLLMDEATSALDPATESAIMKEIAGLKDFKTVIMVAHRLSTVQDCNILFFLHAGRVVAQGTYEELLLRDHDFKIFANV